MGKLATRDLSEREDDEAERLVRPAPKLKPPRRDKRREDMDTDSDSDPDMDSKDKSLNYKVVGRLMARYAKKDRVPAVKKDTGETVMVSPKTLSEGSSKYEALKPEEEPNEEKPQSQEEKPQGRDEKKSPESEGDPEEKKDTQEDASDKGDPKGPPKGKGKKLQEADTPSEGEKQGVGEPERDPPTPAEKEATALLLADNLPPKLAAKLIIEGIHPKDAQTLVNSYKAMSAKQVGNPADYAAKASSFYETDPAKVKPPKTWKTASGEKVPFDSLPADEQAEAYRQHQMQVVATSLAVQNQLQKKLSLKNAAGVSLVPPAVAATLAESLVRGPKKAKALEAAEKKLAKLEEEGDEDAIKEHRAKMAKLERKTSKVANQIFEEMLTAGPAKNITASKARKLMSYLKDNPDAAKKARAYLEANDYKVAKDQFLNKGDLSEDDDPSKIASSLTEARRFFSERAEDYGSSSHQGGRYYEAKVLAKLKELAPEKYAKVRQKMAEQDAKAYEAAKKSYEKALKAWEAQPEDRRGEKPEAPTEPLSYSETKDTATLRSEGKDLLKDLEARSQTIKIATTIAGRFLISTYSECKAMAASHREPKIGVYHGIDPMENYPSTPRREWGQAHQRDLDEDDYGIILESAKNWLKSPVLTQGVEGMVKDQRFRHALDLAIQSSPYNRAIDIPTYNMLLARLQGVPTPGLDQPGLPTLTAAVKDRKKLERAIYRKFPPDSKSKQGGKLHVMLTGDTARVLRKDAYDMVYLEDLSDSDLEKLAGTMRVKTAAEDHDHKAEKAKFVFDGMTPEVETDLETSEYFFRDAEGDTHEDGYLRVIRSNGNTLTVEYPEGAKAEALKAAEAVARKHKLTVKVASSSIESLKGDTSSLNTHTSEDLQEKVPMKLSSAQKTAANQMLERLDKMAASIQASCQAGAIPFKVAKPLVQSLDKTADELEAFTYGADSLRRRQAEVAVSDSDFAKEAKELIGSIAFEKAAAVLQRDSDEPYMDTFKNPMQPHETDGDEPYMQAYSDDQSSAVDEGVSEDGDELTPNN